MPPGGSGLAHWRQSCCHPVTQEECCCKSGLCLPQLLYWESTWHKRLQDPAAADFDMALV